MDSTAIFAALAVFVTIVALGSFVNVKFLRLPPAIGMMVIGLVLSLAVVGLHAAGLSIGSAAESYFRRASFSDFLMRGVLSFLLFAGGLNIELPKLRDDGVVIGTLATLGVLMSTFFIGAVFFIVLRLIQVPLSFGYCLVFGALISPTDPVAILSIFEQLRTRGNLYTKIAGESLFNDGVGVVTFVVALSTASGAAPAGAVGVLELVAAQALGGAAFGFALGWVVYRLLRSIDNYTVEILLTLALVTGGYALASLIHVSGPLAMVVAGLLIGNKGRAVAMSATTRRNLDLFWKLIDEFLNAALFVWMGLEVLVLSFTWRLFLAGLIAVPVALLARFLSVGSAMGALRIRLRFPPGSVRILTWGGLRGALAVAMALSIPPGSAREVIVAITYVVVVFSILVQGLTIKPLLLRSWERPSVAKAMLGPVRRVLKSLSPAKRK